MKRKILGLLILITFLSAVMLLAGCSKKEVSEETEEVVSEEEAGEKTTEEGTTPTEEKATTTKEPTETAPVTTATGECIPTWVCISKIYKAYRNADCTFSQKTECKIGCLDGACRPAPTCTPGFKCVNAEKKGYQKEDCSWTNEVVCEAGCVNNACKEIATESTSSSEDQYLVEDKPIGSSCTEGWKCFNSEYKIFQEANCLTRDKTYCSKGCSQGACVTS